MPFARCSSRRGDAPEKKKHTRAPAKPPRAFFIGLHSVTSRSPYYLYCLHARSLCNLTEKGSRAFFVFIPCAGAGMRASASLPKQYQWIAGRPLLYHTLSAFNACPELAHILVVLAPEDAHFEMRHFEGLCFEPRHCGGASRQLSVLNGLNALADRGASAHDWVLVHDAARPGITPALIRALIDA